MEDVNFPLDQSQMSSALRGVQQAGEANSRPSPLEDSEDDSGNNDEEVEQTAQAERTVIAENRVQTGEQTQQGNQTNIEDII